MTDEPTDCPIDFNTFVLSLSSNALASLPGDAGSGEKGAGRSDTVELALAKQTVDILELLEEKTTGNLTGEEERLLHQVLRDVRERVSAHRS